MKSSGAGYESSGVNQNNPSQVQHVQGHPNPSKGQHYSQGHQVQTNQGQGYMQSQQQSFQQKQFNTNVNKRGMNRGQMSNRGQTVNRGQGLRNQGQPISVLGQGQQSVSSYQVGRGRGHVRGQGQNRGRGRGLPKQTNIVQLQQVELHDNIDYESYDSQIGSESSGNRTVLPLSSGSRQVMGMNSMGASLQGTPEWNVKEKKEAYSPQRVCSVSLKNSLTC